MHHRSLPARWSFLTVPLFVLCACVPPQPYENISHLNYGATEYSADLAQCRHRSATTVAITQGNYVLSGSGWTKSAPTPAWQHKDGSRLRPRLLG